MGLLVQGDILHIPRFGRDKDAPNREAQPEGIAPILDGTVTKTGNEERTAERIRA